MILVHTNRDSIGALANSDPAAVAAIPPALEAHNGDWLKGLVPSTSTGQVVANEIGSLATQTSDSTKQIEEIIRELIDNSQKSIETMNEVKAIIDQQAEYVQQTQEIFRSVEKEIDQSLFGIASTISDIAVDVQNDVDVFVVPENEDAPDGKTE